MNNRHARRLQTTTSGHGFAIGCEAAGINACQRLGDLKRARVAAQRAVRFVDQNAGFRLTFADKLLAKVVVARKVSVQNFLAAKRYRDEQAKKVAATPTPARRAYEQPGYTGAKAGRN